MAELIDSMITFAGLNALANASATGESIKPKYFKVTDQDLALDPNLVSADIVGWRTQDINAYLPVTDGELKFQCIIEPLEATDYIRFVGLYLEDGTLFMIAKPPYAFPPTFRQGLGIQMKFANYTAVLDFTYLPNDAIELDLNMLLLSVANAEQTLKNSLKIEGITKIQGVELDV